jgi:hypothetical protein
MLYKPTYSFVEVLYETVLVILSYVINEVDLLGSRGETDIE